MIKEKEVTLLFFFLAKSVIPDYYGGPQLSHENQMLRANYKWLTSNSNRSQQIQIAHIKFKSPTANSNRSQQIKVAHSKFKLLTANYKLLTPLGVFGYLRAGNLSSESFYL